MKLSADSDSAFYDAELVGNCQVLLNGVDVAAQCTFADEENGFVIMTPLDETGALKATDDGWLVHEKVHGEVRIIDTRHIGS